MEPLYLKYNKQGFEIAGFPCNQFANQEPDSNAQIEAFARGKYNATYDLYSKIDVNGNDAIALYKFLKAQIGPSAITWNFTKFLINRDGVPVKRYMPGVNPDDIEPDIIAELAKPASQPVGLAGP
jgi:glutathione peroxidase